LIISILYSIGSKPKNNNDARATDSYRYIRGGYPPNPPLYTPYFDGVKGGDDSLIKIFRKKIQKFENYPEKRIKNFLEK
jgi:hypothetical protein